MAIKLMDDGTMDTTVCCSDCGEEGRYNYDPAFLTDGDDTEREMEDDYDNFVEWALEDFGSSHECIREHRMK